MCGSWRAGLRYTSEPTADSRGSRVTSKPTADSARLTSIPGSKLGSETSEPLGERIAGHEPIGDVDAMITDHGYQTVDPQVSTLDQTKHTDHGRVVNYVDQTKRTNHASSSVKPKYRTEIVGILVTGVRAGRWPAFACN